MIRALLCWLWMLAGWAELLLLTGLLYPVSPGRDRGEILSGKASCVTYQNILFF